MVSISYAPCDECLEKWNQGFLLVEASETPIEEGQSPIREGIYPTGNYIVLSQDAADRLFGEQAAHGKAFISVETFKDITKSIKEPSKEAGEEL